MLRNIEKDILLENSEYLNIALFGKKLNVLVIGGGKAALIKIKTLIKSNANVTVIGKEIIDEIKGLKKINLINEGYKKSFLKGNHLIIICINEKNTLKEIINNCNEMDKIYLNCTDADEGMFVMQSSVSSKNINVALNVKGKNPKGAMFIKSKIENTIDDLDSFIEYTTKIRNKIKNREDKKEILEFIHSDDFKFIFFKGKGETTLKMFFENI